MFEGKYTVVSVILMIGVILVLDFKMFEWFELRKADYIATSQLFKYTFT